MDNDTSLMLDFQRFFIFTLHLTAFDKLFGFRSRFSALFLTTLFLRQTVKNGNSANLTKTNCRKKGFFCFVARFLQNFFHVLFVHVFIGYIAIFLKLCLQELAPFRNGQFLVLIFEKLTNLIACLARFYNIYPVTARPKGIGTGDNLNLISSFQLRSQWHHTAIYLGTNCFFPNFGMDFIRKINRTRIFWQ
ncbi:hypothetical protein D8895_13350 [Streptococcus sp. BCA20]|nr:hypothetical protein D8895_13350 [Streptococcus sp. BCA20]